jgi:molecular chaperone DnaJ
MAAKTDYYETLGVARDASEADIKKAFRKAAMQYHPDRNPGDQHAEEMFKSCAEAYDVLSDADKRSRYDRFGHAAFQSGGGGGPGHANMDDLFNHFGDIFGDIFGGRGGGRQRRASRGADLRYDLAITLEQAVAGVRQELNVPRVEACDTCHGSGAKAGTQPDSCPQCHGRGQLNHQQGPFMFSVTCSACQGQGRVLRPQNRCGNCGGAGRQRVDKKVSVKIPPGVDTGVRLRVAGEGERGESGQPAGDLYVVVSVQQHDVFQRDGDDLHCEIEVPVVRAVLGGVVEVPLIDGGVDQVKLPAGIQPGERVRIRGQGVPHLSGSGRGDQFAHVKVVVPKKLSGDEKSLYEQLAGLAKAD